MKKYFILIMAFSLSILTSCDEELNVTNPAVLGLDKFINDGPSAKIALNHAYNDLQQTYVAGAYPKMFSGLYADNFDHTGSFPTFTEFWTNNIITNNVNLSRFYRDHYDVINTTTEVIRLTEALSSNVITVADRNTVLGEAYALRAFSYFELVKVFGGLPITERTVPLDGDAANNTARSSEAEVYTYIESQIALAEGKITTTDNTRFSNNALQVLKAKVQLYQNDFPGAESTLQPLIGQYSLATTYASLFGGGDTPETIFRVGYSNADSNSLAFFFYPSSQGGRREVAPSSDLLNSFPAGDVRKDLIANNATFASAYLNKYTDTANGTDSPYIFRYADVLLMYAELLARRNDANADTYFNMVRTRAGLGNLSLNSTNVVDLISNERRWEFYGEGDRWDDVKRLGIAQQVIENNKTVGTWAPFRLLWPIPQDELNLNDLMSQADQNPGY